MPSQTRKAKSLTQSRNRKTKSRKSLVSSIPHLKKISNLFFKSQLQKNKYYRINVSIECFYFIDNIVNKIDVDLSNQSPEAILNIIVEEILKSYQSETYKIGGGSIGGANMRKILYSIVKWMIYLACYGFILIAFIHGTQRCAETKTMQSLMNNSQRYFSRDTKCKHTELPYFSTYFNYFLKNTKLISQFEKKIIDPQKYLIEEIYSITICDEYNHLGKDDIQYCKDKSDSIYCTFVQNTPVSILDTVKTIDQYLKPATYFSTKNYETDIKTILNDIDTCRNNMLTPVFWALSSREILERKALYLTSLYGILHFNRPKAKTV